MKNMRQLINLMEGVMAVPGVGAQPSGTESDMQNTGTIGRNNDYASFDAAQGQATEESVGGFDDYLAGREAMARAHKERIGAAPGDEMAFHQSLRQYYKDQDALDKKFPDQRNAYVKDQNDKMWANNDWQSLGGNRSAVDEKSSSEKQARFMAAAAHDPAFAKKVGISQGVAKEFNQADKGTKQLSKAMKHKNECSMMEEPESPPQVVSCNQDNPENARKACAMEGMMEQTYSPEVQEALTAFENAVVSYGMAPEDAYDRISQRLSDDGVNEFHAALEAAGKFGDEEDDGGMGIDDYSDDAEALASAGHGSDEDYGDFPMDEAFDLNNGYDDINDASGNDYFPSGADSPVVRDAGPSGARQGDNPEQKKMQVDEVHKELVYGYRNFLKENAKK